MISDIKKIFVLSVEDFNIKKKMRNYRFCFTLNFLKTEEKKHIGKCSSQYKSVLDWKHL